MSHVINITGRFCRSAEWWRWRAKNAGIPVVVDGALRAQFRFQISDLECDYYGVSLHKWLAARRTGLLYVRKDKIKGLWPMMAARSEQDEDIRKFEEIGTHPAANWLAIAEASHVSSAAGRRAQEGGSLLRYWARP